MLTFRPKLCSRNHRVQPLELEQGEGRADGIVVRGTAGVLVTVFPVECRRGRKG